MTTDSQTLTFRASYVPALEAGSYSVAMTQTVQVDKEVQHFATQRTFHVAGERFVLNPQDICAVFPPAGSLGDHATVLPHIIFTNSTLPWERDAHSDNGNRTPWLALLLFDETEAPSPQSITLNALIATPKQTARFPAISLEPGQQGSDLVTVIDVPQALLASILPNATELRWLAHVREREDTRYAVLIANRLPQRNRASVVHLVSVEARYNGEQFAYQGAGNNDLIRLVSLHSWRFTCDDPEQTFRQLVQGLNHSPSTVRLPGNDNPTAEAYLAMGYVPLPHSLRQGSTTVAWYHGPLAPGGTAGDLTLPVRTADDLLVYNPENGLFDVAYAAAWELGRLLTLQNGRVATALAQWKLAHRRHLCCVEAAIHSHLPFQPLPTDEAAPELVQRWFAQLAKLEGIPFNYLIPDEALLPPESIRFFQIDPLWLDALLDGAFSIGRVTQHDYTLDCQHTAMAADHPAKRAPTSHPTVSGFLLRSELVAGWPGLLVDGYDHVFDTEGVVAEEQQVALVRMARLSANVLLCLFAGAVKTVDLYLQPETLHFGVDVADDDPERYIKRLRSPTGENDGPTVDPLPWRSDSQRVLDMDALADYLPNRMRQPAAFAVAMIEGVEKVRLSRAAP